jgi:Winged helix DNA-binding domain
VKASEIAQWRMHNLGLWGRPATSATEVVARLGAMQAQEFPYARWSIAQRASDVGDSEIAELFDDGAFIRTHVLRPTWHFVMPSDIRWMLRLTAPRVKAMGASYERRLELDERIYARTNRIIERALAGGTHMTRKELVSVLTRSKITGTGQRFGHILLRAELDGVVCSGIPMGKQQTYALLEERVPEGRALDGDEALAELARRYFTTRGPATLKDFSWWSSLKMGDCRRGVEILGEELEDKEVADRTYWFARGSAPPAPTKDVVDLVQVYDEVVVSYTVSRDALTDTITGEIPRGIMFFWHPILLGGQGIGHWRRRSQGSRAWIELFLYRKLSRNESRSLDVALQRYQDFLGAPIEVKWLSILQ